MDILRELNEFMRLRASIYDILSAPFYREPDIAYVQELQKYIAVLDAVAMENNNDKMIRVVASLKNCINDGLDYDMLAGIFARLFLGVNKASAEGHTVTPHESVYLGSSRLAMQEPWEDIYEEFCNEGVGKNDDFKEPEDHISAEMGYMAHLSRKTANLIEKDEYVTASGYIDKQISFLNKHLLLWTRLLADDITRSTDNDFYINMAILIDVFITADELFLSELSEAVK